MASKEFNLSGPLLDLEGEQYVEKKKDSSGNLVTKHYTIRDAIRESLVVPLQDDTADQKLQKFDLCMKCATDPVKLTPEDIVLIKETVGKVQGPLFFGRVRDHIDPKDQAESKAK